MAENQNLKQKTINGMIWKAVDVFAAHGFSFVIGIILARILMPSDYGLISMLAIFILISELLINGGFSNALIQKQDRTDADFSTVFYFNIAVSVFCYIILFFSAPYIATFYNEPILTPLTRILSLNFIINSLSIIQRTILTIHIDFKTQAKVAILSAIISGVLGIVAAYQGFGVWAIVIQQISNAIIQLFTLYYFNRWLPKRIFSQNSFKTLFNFGSKLLIAGLLSVFFNNLYSLIIGKVFSTKDLGFYTRAKQYPELIYVTTSTILQGVSYPVLASLQENKEKLVEVYSKLMGTVVFVIIPTMTLFAMLSEPFIRLLLTEKWMPAATLMQWLCLARMFTPISSLNMNILNAIGRSDLFLKIDVSKIPMVVVALVITIPLGLKAVVIGHAITSFIAYFINAYYPGKFFNFGAIKQIYHMRYVALSTSIMAVIVYFILSFLHSDLLKLILGTSFGVIIYLFLATIFKMNEMKELKILLSKIFRKK